MTSDHELREALISAFEHLRQQNSVLHDLINEIASVRDALIEIGPKYEEILTRHRVRRARETKPFAADDFQKFDVIIQRLREP
jgi:hypothetical protein